MNQLFEKNYVIDNSRDADGPREKHHKIELSDREHVERELTKDTKVISLRNKDAKNKSKSVKSKPKKNNPKSNRATMASVEEKL